MAARGNVNTCLSNAVYHESNAPAAAGPDGDRHMARMANWDDLEQSATAGDGVAAFELGMGHASGSGGLTVDLIRAHCWFNVACARGYGEAKDLRREIAAEMSAVEVVAAQKLARAMLVARG